MRVSPFIADADTIKKPLCIAAFWLVTWVVWKQQIVDIYRSTRNWI